MPDPVPLEIEQATPREKRKRWVRGLLVTKGILISKLAAHLGISEHHLYRGLYEQNPYLADVHRKKIVVILGVDIFASYEPPKGLHDTAS